MRITLVLLIVGLICAAYAQDAAKDTKDTKAADDKAKADLPDASKVDKDATTTPDPKDVSKKADDGAKDAAAKGKDAAAKAKDDLSSAGKKLQDGLKL